MIVQVSVVLKRAVVSTVHINNTKLQEKYAVEVRNTFLILEQEVSAASSYGRFEPMP